MGKILLKALVTAIAEMAALALMPLLSDDKKIWIVAAALPGIAFFIWLVYDVNPEDLDISIIRRGQLTLLLFTLILIYVALEINLPPSKSPTGQLTQIFTQIKRKIRPSLSPEKPPFQSTEDIVSIIDKDPQLCADLYNNGRDMQAIAAMTTGFLRSSILTFIFSTIFLIDFFLPYFKKTHPIYQNTSLGIFFIFIFMAIFFILIKNLHFSERLSRPDVLAVGASQELSATFAKECELVLDPATMPTPPPLEARILPTVVHNAPGKARNFQTQPEPIDEHDYLFFDQFVDNSHKWNNWPDRRSYGIEFNNEKLILSLMPIYTKNEIFSGCQDNCKLEFPQDRSIAIKMKMDPIKDGSRKVSAGIGFGAAQSTDVATDYYSLVVNNDGQLKLLYFQENFPVDTLFNQKSSSFEISPNENIAVQLDIYNQENCPERFKKCFLLSVNGRPVMPSLKALPYPLDGYIGVYAILQGSSDYNRIITYDAIKIWSAP